MVRTIFQAFFIVFLLAASVVGSEPRSSEKRSGKAAREKRLNSAENFNAQQQSIANSRRTAITRAVQRVNDSVVGINVIRIRNRRNIFNDDPFFSYFFPSVPRREKVESLGSGFIVDREGHVVTNQHVVRDAAEITVTLTDGSQHIADVVGDDDISDIALLKMRDPGVLKPVSFGASNDLLIGEWVIAFGNPFGLFDLNAKPTVTVGVISALDQDFGKLDDHVYKDMIQTDASINQGNSGGPLVNALGQVIGMNTFIFSGNGGGSIGLGFAIPADRLLVIIDEIKRFGKVNRTFNTGIEIENLTRRVAWFLGLRSTQGAVITNIQKNSSGERAGLKVADVILQIEGKAISKVSDVDAIIEERDARPGELLELTVYRNKQIFSTKLRL